jgi:endoglucanase
MPSRGSIRTAPAVLADRWQRGFNYIATSNTAPILVGEFGGKQVGTDTIEGKWQNQFVDFLGAERHSFAYWSWNPNSTDTGGILTSDWNTVDQAKQSMLNRLLTGTPATTTSTTATPPSTTTTTVRPPTTTTTTRPPPTTTTIPPAGGVTVTQQVTSDWGAGYCTNVVVSTTSTTPIDWKVTFTIQGKVRELWNANWKQKGKSVTADGLSWNDTVKSGSPASFGFCANR